MEREDELELVGDDLGDEDEVEEIEELAHEQLGGVRVFAVGLVVGALIGATGALLLAPDRGEETRRRIGAGLRHIQHDAREQLGDWREDARRRVRRQRRRIKRRLKQRRG